MSKDTVVELAGQDTIIDPLPQLLRTGAEQLIYQAVEAELQELLDGRSDGQLMAERVSCVTAICQRENYRRALGRSRSRYLKCGQGQGKL